MKDLRYSFPSRAGDKVETITLRPPEFAEIAKGRAHLTWHRMQWESTEMFKRLRAAAREAASEAEHRADLTERAKAGDDAALKGLQAVIEADVAARLDAMNTTEAELQTYYAQATRGWDLALPLVTGFVSGGVEVPDFRATLSASPYYVEHLSEIARRVFLGDWEDWTENEVHLEGAADAPVDQ